MVVAQREYTMFIPEDTTTPYILDTSEGKFVLTEEGTGMPPVEYITERGPFQNGETVKAVFLRPRIVQLSIRQNYCDRTKYWDGRAELLNILRPNRGSNGTLRRILSDGRTRDLTCSIQQGPNFQPRKTDAWDEWAFTEVLRFVAHNPVYYNPTVHTLVFGYYMCGEFPYTFPIDLSCEDPLEFPITFPITFGEWSAQDIVYAGDWEEFPKFVITGPLQIIRITNETTDEEIVIVYPLALGQSMTIDLTYAHKTVTLDDGTNLLPYVQAGSDLATFHFKAKATNVIRVNVYGAGAATTATMTYYDRYIGI